MAAGPGVDHVVDCSAEHFADTWPLGKFRTVAIFNVLEHTYDPIRVLTNALACLCPSGHILVSVPAIWQLHDHPRDYVRFAPHWFEEFATRNGLTISREHFVWLSCLGIQAIDSLRMGDQLEYPTFRNATPKDSRYWISRISHRLLNTWGRNHWATNVSIGAALSRNQ